MEMAHLPSPYISLGFDQRAIANDGAAVSVSMGKMQTIEFLSQYGRPLYVDLTCKPQLLILFTRWHATLPEEKPGEMITTASLKLRGGKPFSARNKDHVFAVLSQRLCLDPVIVNSEALKLADHSVAHHMRLLTGFSTNYKTFYTHLPSEPILVMGSADILYNNSHPDRLQLVLDTLSKDLCSTGLVEKGVLGELGARTLLLIARDFAAPLHTHSRNLLKPVHLLDFLHTLFQKDMFNHSEFDKAFDGAYVNFTHWIITRDSIPEKPNP
jgi:hypothetical protein